MSGCKDKQNYLIIQTFYRKHDNHKYDKIDSPY